MGSIYILSHCPLSSKQRCWLCSATLTIFFLWNKFGNAGNRTRDTWDVKQVCYALIFDEQLRLWRTGDRVSATVPRVAAPKPWMPIFFTAGTNSRNYGNSSRAVKEELDVYQRRVPQTDWQTSKRKIWKRWLLRFLRFGLACKLGERSWLH